MRCFPLPRNCAVLLGAAASVAGAVAAPQCSLAGPAGAKISVAGAVRELPELLADCNAVKIVAGEVTACVQDRRNRLSCRTFAAGETLTERALGAAGREHGMLTALTAMLRGGATNAPAITRGSPTHLPTGPVVLALGGVDVDFSQPALAGVEFVEFRDVEADRVIARVDSNGPHRLAGELFRPGHSYRWTLASAVPMLAPSARFTVQNATLRAQADAEARRVRATNKSPAADLMLAHWLLEHGLEYDAQAILQRAGFSPP